MICPHCLRTIEDGTAFCPYCHGYVGLAGRASRSGFIFCEGCGAKLSPHDRVCPKCGRPAPGILSTKSAAPDLAAGKTASFPRLSREQLDHGEAELSRDALTASRVAVDSVDPFATTVLRPDDLERAGRAAKARPEAPSAPDPAKGDPYHKPKNRFIKPVLTVLVLAALGAGGYWFVTRDPLGLMPQIERSVREQAAQMFPSRVSRGSSASVDADSVAAEEAQRARDAQSSTVLTDDQAYQRLTASYKAIVRQHDAISTIVDDYNSYIFASDAKTREEGSSSAYAARDALDATIADLQSMKLADGSAYADDRQNLIQLAGWVRVRVDRYCASWDVSLSFKGDDEPYDHQDEILQPYRDRYDQDEEASSAYYANVDAYEPQPLS